MNLTSPTGHSGFRLTAPLVLLTCLCSEPLAAAPAEEIFVPAEKLPEIRSDERTPYFTLNSNRSVGDRGEIHLDVSLEEAECDAQWRFHSAEIHIKANRFGDAQFVALPAPGCIECAEIVVRWMHEPTGHIDFDVNVFRERHMESCEEESQ